MPKLEPPPLSSFLSEPPPLSSFFSRDEPVATAPPADSTVEIAPCLRAPNFLGTHHLCLGEELPLDDGALRIRTGAAMHDDSTVAAFLQQQQLVGDGPTPGASGSRLLGGTFLRAALSSSTSDGASQDAPALHVWLSPTTAASDQPQMAAVATEAAGDVHVLWPYRIRVLTAEVRSTAAQDGLKPSETLDVHVAVDRISVPAARHGPPLPLPVRDGAATIVWLSTQAQQHVAFGASDAAAGTASTTAADDVSAASEDTPKEAAATSTLLPLPSLMSLPPLLPAISSGGGGLGIGSGSPEEADSLDVSLHVRPLRPAEEAEEPFGCPPWQWSAELACISLGEDEGHVSVPLRVSSMPAEPVRVGGYALRVRQCVGHHVSSVGDGAVLSEYPMLLLHAELEISCADEDDEGGIDLDVDAMCYAALESRELGDALERLLG